jgi:hypothetical protein
VVLTQIAFALAIPQRSPVRLTAVIVSPSSSARMPAVKRRTILQALPAATFLSASLWAASQRDEGNPMQASTGVYELRIYHAAPGKLPELLARFRDHTDKLFDRHGMKSIAYWTPVDEPEKSNTLVYILYHPSREAAAANWKSFQDDPEWKSVKEKSEANGKLAEKIDSTYLALTDFSPPLR